MPQLLAAVELFALVAGMVVERLAHVFARRVVMGVPGEAFLHELLVEALGDDVLLVFGLAFKELFPDLDVAIEGGAHQLSLLLLLVPVEDDTGLLLVAVLVKHSFQDVLELIGVFIEGG